jgi:hypothetical protein
MNSSIKSCKRCGGAILTGITGWGGAICMCVYPATKESAQIVTDNSHVNLNQINLLVENDRLKAELEAMRKDRNAIIEECAAVCDQFEIAEYAADEIRKLKVGE